MKKSVTNAGIIKLLPHFILLFITLLMFTPVIQAQNSRTIQGIVRDSVSGETLPGAHVVVMKGRIGTTTNSVGRFTLLDLPTDSLTLRVSYLGYESKELPVGASEDLSFLEIELRQQAIGMEAIEVTAGKSIDVVGDISQVKITPEQIDVLPTIGEVDVFRALQLLPGIATSGDGSGLYVRGGTPDQNLVLFDGMTMYHVDHFFGLFSAFNADAVKDVQAYTGGFPAKYGGRVSSVLELTGKDGNNQDFQAGAGVNLLSARGVVEVPLGGKGSWLIAGRRSYTDIMKTSLYSSLFDSQLGEDAEPNTGFGGGGQIVQLQPDFYFYDLNSKLTYRPTRNDQVSFSFYTGSDQLDQTASSAPRRSGNVQVEGREHVTDWGNRGVSGRWFREWSPRLSTDLLIASSRYFSENVNITENSGQREENEVNDLSARLDVEWQVAQGLTFDFGTWWTQNSVSYQFTRLAEDSVSLGVDRTAEGRFAGGYSQGTWRIRNRVDLTAGFRATHYDLSSGASAQAGLTGAMYWEPRASLTWSLTGRIKMKGAWGRFHQFVTRVENEDVLEGSRDFWLLAEDDLLPVASEHRILGASYEGTDYLFNVEVYDKTFEDLSLFSTRYRQDPEADPDELFMTGDGRARGLEVLAQKLTGSVTGWISYTLGRVNHWFSEVDDGAKFPANHDQTHTIKAVGTYAIGKWQLSGSWIYGSGRPYTSPLSQYFLTMLDGEVQSYIGVGEKNSLRFPAYHRLDLAAFRRFEMKHFDWEIGVSFYNVYNRENIWYRHFDLDEQPITVTDVEMLGFTPSIDLRFNLK